MNPVFCKVANPGSCEFINYCTLHRFELVVYLEGTSESTGTTMQARYSYRNGDVLWGHRFQSAISYDPTALNYVICFEKFEKTVSVATPLISARNLDLLWQHGGSPPPLSGGEQLVIFDSAVFNPNNVVLNDVQEPLLPSLPPPLSL
ncbi:hypothetical protein HAZT_HAZT004580, partial [Hyalella azteca]